MKFQNKWKDLINNNNTAPVLIVSYELILKDEEFFKHFKYSTIIIDEGHRLKSNSSKLYQYLYNEINTNAIYLLTGTPIQNNMIELYTLLSLVNREYFNNEKDFLDYFYKNNELCNKDDLQIILKPFLLRRTKSSVSLNLPPLEEKVIYVPMSALQKQYYKWVLEKNYDNLGKDNSRKLSNIVQQLCKACNHPYLFDGAEEEPFEEGDHLWKNAGKV